MGIVGIGNSSNEGSSSPLHVEVINFADDNLFFKCAAGVDSLHCNTLHVEVVHNLFRCFGRSYAGQTCGVMAPHVDSDQIVISPYKTFVF